MAQTLMPDFRLSQRLIATYSTKGLKPPGNARLHLYPPSAISNLLKNTSLKKMESPRRVNIYADSLIIFQYEKKTA